MSEHSDHMKKFYPELKDIKEASELIQNGLTRLSFENLNILSEEETEQLLTLLDKWNYNYIKYKEESIDALIKELNEKG